MGKRSMLALLPAVVVFTGWDVAAIQAGWWHFDRRYLSGVFLPGRLPLEELLFFVVVPICAILTFEAVRRLQPTWRAGDETPGHGTTVGAKTDAKTAGRTDDTTVGRTNAKTDGTSEGTSDGPAGRLARP